ncbi:unnamed protein product [Heligmosomoides polygyrus]|uniref:Uncharacterized protein n=1 Tax=Heligmosomoides polygyrus TaxID=6339 RepID=A0A3P7VWZ4_HELPZ|nr:unnamed protein product [Heligmosomoides polygyrus]
MSFFYEKVLKFELEVELYTRSHQRSIGNTSLWDMAEKVIRDEFWEKGGTFRLKEGAAPHYGPRFEIKARDRWGRYSLCGSIQIDFELPERFDLGYLRYVRIHSSSEAHEGNCSNYILLSEFHPSLM